jgi:hypothetical protein
LIFNNYIELIVYTINQSYLKLFLSMPNAMLSFADDKEVLQYMTSMSSQIENLLKETYLMRNAVEKIIKAEEIKNELEINEIIKTKKNKKTKKIKKTKAELIEIKLMMAEDMDIKLINLETIKTVQTTTELKKINLNSDIDTWDSDDEPTFIPSPKQDLKVNESKLNKSDKVTESNCWSNKQDLKVNESNKVTESNCWSEANVTKIKKDMPSQDYNQNNSQYESIEIKKKINKTHFCPELRDGAFYSKSGYKWNVLYDQGGRMVSGSARLIGYLLKDLNSKKPYDEKENIRICHNRCMTKSGLFWNRNTRKYDENGPICENVHHYKDENGQTNICPKLLKFGNMDKCDENCRNYIHIKKRCGDEEDGIRCTKRRQCTFYHKTFPEDNFWNFHTTD